MTTNGWREEHRQEVAGKGRWPLDPEYIDEFIKTKARDSAEWAIAYALLDVALAIRSAGQKHRWRR